jgi:branched-chain amino acid transport system permease protein
VVVAAGAAALIEMVYHLQLAAAGTPLNFLGVSLDTSRAGHWIAAAALLLAGLALFVPVRRRFAQRWSRTQVEIEHQLRQREQA